MSESIIENLEARALKQRDELHQATTDLKVKIADVRYKASLSTILREHFVGVALGISSAALLLGYSFAGRAFCKRR
jgi:hypothetical protein